MAEKNQEVQPAAMPPGEFRVGVVLSKSFAVFFRNIVSFVVLALVVTSPTHIYMGYMTLKVMEGTPPDPFSLVAVAVQTGGMILWLILTAAITYGTYQDLRGRKASLIECLMRGLPLIFPVLGVAIIYFLMMMLGFVALVIPGVFVFVIYMVAVPVAVVERPGVFKSLSRSAALTKGSRWRVFGAYLVFLILSAVMMMIIGLAMTGVAFQTDLYGGGIALTVMNYVSGAFLAALGAVVIAVIYHELRMAKEGVDAEEIAAVFD